MCHLTSSQPCFVFYESVFYLVLSPTYVFSARSIVCQIYSDPNKYTCVRQIRYGNAMLFYDLDYYEVIIQK